MLPRGGTVGLPGQPENAGRSLLLCSELTSWTGNVKCDWLAWRHDSEEGQQDRRTVVRNGGPVLAHRSTSGLHMDSMQPSGSRLEGRRLNYSVCCRFSTLRESFKDTLTTRPVVFCECSAVHALVLQLRDTDIPFQVIFTQFSDGVVACLDIHLFDKAVIFQDSKATLYSGFRWRGHPQKIEVERDHRWREGKPGILKQLEDCSIVFTHPPGARPHSSRTALWHLLITPGGFLVASSTISIGLYTVIFIAYGHQEQFNSATGHRLPGAYRALCSEKFDGPAPQRRPVAGSNTMEPSTATNGCTGHYYSGDKSAYSAVEPVTTEVAA